jgi:hypothetical protein
MVRHASLLAAAVLAGATCFPAACVGQTPAAPIRQGDLVLTTSDPTAVQSEDQVLLALPAGTTLVAGELKDGWVLVIARKEGKEVTGYVHADSLRRVEMRKHAGPRGLSLKYPEGWKVASAEERAEVAGSIKRYFEQFSGADPARVPVMIYNPGQEEYAENVNCSVGRGPVPEMTAEGAKQYVAPLRGEFEKLGARLTSVRAEAIEVGNRKAISARWDISVRGIQGPIRQWQVLVPGKSELYAVTCSALASRFERYEQLFSAVIQSVEVDAPGGKP